MKHKYINELYRYTANSCGKPYLNNIIKLMRKNNKSNYDFIDNLLSLKISQNILNKFKIPYKYEENNLNYRWDGKRLNLFLLIGDENLTVEEVLYNLLHEVSHYIVSSKTSRNKPGYGLGSAAFDHEYLRSKLTHNYVTKMEEISSVLSILMANKFGLNTLNMSILHGWPFSTIHEETVNSLIGDCYKAINYLLNKNYINKYGKVNLLKGITLEKLYERNKRELEWSKTIHQNY